MKNTLRRIMQFIWIIPQKPSKKNDNNKDDNDEDDQFYDAMEEPTYSNPPHPPLSDTDSSFEEASPPFFRLPISTQTSPLLESPWTSYVEQPALAQPDNYVGLMTSLVREEGHIYSLAASGDLVVAKISQVVGVSHVHKDQNMAILSTNVALLPWVYGYAHSIVASLRIVGVWQQDLKKLEKWTKESA
ncbi:hypothetical protein L1987_46868 [Smallanthus sonchifolius]|uniref:Uncharacterized protein n=1 Tax=Smallanthus sonchifolius TaxID=185202 RepID=A0ACB9G0M1_9ASTR|nr:hypothetical protein L1987_46868 [Smallanthus sonchifolius]